MLSKKSQPPKVCIQYDFFKYNIPKWQPWNRFTVAKGKGRWVALIETDLLHTHTLTHTHTFWFTQSILKWKFLFCYKRIRRQHIQHRNIHRHYYAFGGFHFFSSIVSPITNSWLLSWNLTFRDYKDLSIEDYHPISF